MAYTCTFRTTLVSHLKSDAHVAYDSGRVRITDPGGLMHDLSMTVSENDPKDPTKRVFTLTVTFSESMGATNMVIRTWNTDRQSAEVRVLNALVVMPPDRADPEPGLADPEPGLADPEPGLADPEPTEMLDAAADPEPVEYRDPDGRGMLAVRMWSGFEPESITDTELLHALGLDYPEADIPDWVMTKLGPLVVKGHVTVDQFRIALQYVLENA